MKRKDQRKAGQSETESGLRQALGFNAYPHWEDGHTRGCVSLDTGATKEPSTFVLRASWETEQPGEAGGGGLLWSHTAGTNGFLPAALSPHGSLQQSVQMLLMQRAPSESRTNFAGMATTLKKC